MPVCHLCSRGCWWGVSRRSHQLWCVGDEMWTVRVWSMLLRYRLRMYLIQCKSCCIAIHMWALAQSPCTRGVSVACLTCAAAAHVQRSKLTRDFPQPVQNGCTFRSREEQAGEKVLRKVGRFQTVMRNRANAGIQSSVSNINLQTLTVDLSPLLSVHAW